MKTAQMIETRTWRSIQPEASDDHLKRLPHYRMRNTQRSHYNPPAEAKRAEKERLRSKAGKATDQETSMHRKCVTKITD